MKLTDDDVYAIQQALRHCSKQDAYIFTLHGEKDEETVNFSELYAKFDYRQILESQRIMEVLEREFPNTYEDIKQRIK